MGPGRYTENGSLIPCSVKKGDRCIVCATRDRVECSSLASAEIRSRSTTRTTWFSTIRTFWVSSNKRFLLVLFMVTFLFVRRFIFLNRFRFFSILMSRLEMDNLLASLKNAQKTGNWREIVPCDDFIRLRYRLTATMHLVRSIGSAGIARV